MYINIVWPLVRKYDYHYGSVVFYSYSQNLDISDIEDPFLSVFGDLDWSNDKYVHFEKVRVHLDHNNFRVRSWGDIDIYGTYKKEEDLDNYIEELGIQNVTPVEIDRCRECSNVNHCDGCSKVFYLHDFISDMNNSSEYVNLRVYKDNSFDLEYYVPISQLYFAYDYVGRDVYEDFFVKFNLKNHFKVKEKVNKRFVKLFVLLFVIDILYIYFLYYIDKRKYGSKV